LIPYLPFTLSEYPSPSQNEPMLGRVLPLRVPAAAARHPAMACAANSQAAEQGQQPRTRPTQGELVEGAMFGYPGPPPPLIDVGLNLCDKSFGKDRGEVLRRAQQAGVHTMVITGTSVAASRAARDAAVDYGLYSTAGVHPHDAKTCGADTVGALREIASHERVVAIGECGLDFNRNFSPPDVQEKWFDHQIALACELKLPLFMHCRDAGERFTEILRGHDLTAPGLVHCFTGGREELQGYIDMGLYIGITGWVCDEREYGETPEQLCPPLPSPSYLARRHEAG